MKTCITIFLISLSYLAYSQNQNNNWCFGQDIGLKFNNGSITQFTTNMDAGESCASVSDRHTGELLFYTNGLNVWDNTKSIMPNGVGVGRDTFKTGAQGSLIIPDPADTNMYYLFTKDNTNEPGDLRYSIVDMRLNGGKGDIVANKKNIVVGTNLTEGLATTYACDGQWLLSYKRSADTFVSYKVNAAGVSTKPVISKVSLPYHDTNQVHIVATLKVSPDGKKVIFILITYNRPIGYTGYLTISDFDMKTGKVSNTQLIDSVDKSEIEFGEVYFYHSEFSPNSKLLYVTSSSNSSMYQYDLTSNNIQTIKSSRKLLHSGSSMYGTVQMGPDSNLYVCYIVSNNIDRISNPNAVYPNCVYSHRFLTLNNGSRINAAFPQLVIERPYSKSPTYTYKDTTVCLGDTIALSGRATDTSFFWNTGSTNKTINIATPGKYWVRSGTTIGCGEVVDTFNVVTPSIDFDLGNDTTICAEDELNLAVQNIDTTANFLWNTGNKTRNISIKNSGTYYLTITKENCLSSDTIRISVNDEYLFGLGPDTTLCAGDTLILSVKAGLERYSWSTSDTSNNILVSDAATYSLTVTHEGCSFYDEKIITYKDPSFRIGNDTLLCEGVPHTLRARSLDDSKYLWSTNSVGDSIIINASGTYFVTATNLCGSFTDSITVAYERCDCNPFIPSAFTPNGDGLNDQLKAIINCPVSNYHMIVVNRFGQRVFESNSPNIYWDGTHKGNKCDMGTYYYILKVTDNLGYTSVAKGDIALLK